MTVVLMAGMGEIKTIAASEDAIVALGIGSCIALCAFDPEAGISALAHVVLPKGGTAGDPPGKYAETAAPFLLQEMLARGARAFRIRAAIAGGAQLFSFGGQAPRLDVGARNIEAVKRSLGECGLPLEAEDTGGDTGRSIRLHGDGRVIVKILGQGERELIHLGRIERRRSKTLSEMRRDAELAAAGNAGAAQRTG